MVANYRFAMTYIADQAYGLAYGLVDQTYNELQVTMFQLTKKLLASI